MLILIAEKQLMLILQDSREIITSYRIHHGYGGDYIKKKSNAHVHLGMHFQADGTLTYHILL